MRRDNKVWGTRLSPTGRIGPAATAMTNYAKIYSTPLPTNTLMNTLITPSIAGNTVWTELGPTNVPTGIGQVHRLAFHPQYNGTTNQIIYAGSHYGGLFRTDDGGQNWVNWYTDRGLPITSVSGIAVSNNNLFVCTGNGDQGYDRFGYNASYNTLGPGTINNANPIHTQGVYKYDPSQPLRWVSINGNGVNAVTMIGGGQKNDLRDAFAEGGTMRNIIVHPTNDNILFIATSLGIFRTMDGGNTWAQVLNFTNATDWRGLEFHPTNPNIIYASGRSVFESTDGGANWTILANSNNLPTAFPSINIERTNVAVTPAAPHLLYVYCVGKNSNNGVRSGTVMLYNRQTLTWMLLNKNDTNNGFQSYQPSWTGIAVSPIDSNYVYVTNTKVRGSRTAITGGGWIYQSPYLNSTFHADVHDVEFPPNSKDHLFAVTHGGVSIKATATNGSTGWTRLYNGLGVGNIWAFDDWEGDDNRIVSAHQCVGSLLTNNRGQTWNHVLGGDGYGARIDDQSGWAFIKGNSDTDFWRIKLSGAKVQEDLYLPPTDTVWGPCCFINPNNPASCAPCGERVQNAFAMINHPKTDEMHFGVNGLHKRLILNPSSTDSSTSVWQRISDLTHYYNDDWNRRIMDIAMSEDEQTNITYVSTLNDLYPWGAPRRSDFYVSDDNTSLLCNPAPCFVMKTDSLPITTNPPATNVDPNPITGIAIDPLNGERVWISTTGFDPAIKVLYSDDKGDSWTSYDDSISTLANLNMPINNIVYQRGTNDRLYIATDVGVYVREGTGNWLRYGDEFPNVRTVELKINYCSGKLRAATFGRGAWEADLLPPEVSIDYRSFRTITGIETWNTDKNMVRDIKVKAGAILILDSITLNMPKDGLIVVEPGGLLVVDSSTITNLCGETWQGIEVWGNSNLAQVPSNQGQIIVNASTVEYAKNAISPWEVGNFPNPSTGTGGTGGIITAQNSTFLNNWRSIDFMRYLPPSGGIEKSTIESCTFTINDDYRSFNDDTIPFFLGHVSMWSVGGTSIKGCTFEDERSNKAGDVTTGGSYGLYGLGASPKVSRLLLPSKRTRFEGLERAIELGGGRGTNYTTAIDECTFVDNEQAVIIRAHNDAVIIRDSFEIGGFVSANPNSYFVEEYGLGLINTTSFAAEQNYFISNTSDQTVGSWVEASGSAGNAIRNNQYDNLTGGNLVHGRNDGALPDDGLQYHCNENTSNDYDFTVLANIASNAAPASVSSEQGSITQASRNTFSTSVQSLPSQAQFYNYNYDAAAGQFGAAVRYYYTSNAAASISETPDAALLFNVIDVNVPNIGTSNFCAENYTGTGTFKATNGEGEIISLEELKEGYTTDLGNYDLLKVEYDEIPEEDTTARLDKESELAGAYQNLFFWANQVIQHYANDSIPQNDSLEVWIQKKPGVEAQYELVEHYWRQGRYEDALDQIDSIGIKYPLDSLALKNHNHYKDLKELLQTAYNDGRMEANLEKTEVDALEVIANAKWGFAAVLASDILKFFYFKGTLYYPTLPNMNPIEGRYAQPPNSSPAMSSKGSVLMGAPNPAINWVDLYYELPEDLKTGHLVVTSTTGARITQVELRNNSGQLTLNTKDWVSGIYFATLFSEGQDAKVFKIVIQK